jgi:hypothetical protein
MPASLGGQPKRPGAADHIRATVRVKTLTAPPFLQPRRPWRRFAAARGRGSVAAGGCGWARAAPPRGPSGAVAGLGTGAPWCASARPQRRAGARPPAHRRGLQRRSGLVGGAGRGPDARWRIPCRRGPQLLRESAGSQV